MSFRAPSDGSGSLPLTGGTIDGQLIIDTDNAEALLVRADGDGGDVLAVDTVTPGLVIADGVSTDPAIRFASDPDTGMLLGGTNLIEFRAGGVQAFRISSLNVRVPAGTLGAPGMNFTVDTDTGIRRSAANTMNLVTAGTDAVVIDPNQNVQFQSRYQGAKGADVASAADITLGSGNYFDITGTTQIDTIVATDWQAGSIITLQFDAAVTVADNTAGTGASLLLAGAANFSATADDTLMLVFDGTTWREISRTVI